MILYKIVLNFVNGIIGSIYSTMLDLKSFGFGSISNFGFSDQGCSTSIITLRVLLQGVPAIFYL